MAYSTSSEVNRTDVMDRIKLFAQAQGYSHSALSGSTETDTQFVLSKGGAHFAFRFYLDWLYVVPSLVKPTTTWSSSLPHRQLRKKCAQIVAFKYGSLPHRQLRNSM